jgi:site-specific DNA-methyltransferase (adenine-specific)
MPAQPASRNRSIVLSPADRERLAPSLESALALGSSSSPITAADMRDAIISGDARATLPRLPPCSVDLLIADPPYNMDKTFGAARGRLMSDGEYEEYTRSWLEAALPSLKPDASVYVCCDWHCSSIVQRVLSTSLIVRNRITWEREKGRAAARNWKSAHEDIWFATVSGRYRFDALAVTQRRCVRAPYRDSSGRPKDWREIEGERYRDTAASNLWTDLSVPFWSMRENTTHPAQKPEKLVAKLILASSRPDDLVLDPFLGSGTSAVVAKKLGRCFAGIEIDPEHCLLALRRLEYAQTDSRIQGYEGGVFWERNSGPREGPYTC